MSLAALLALALAAAGERPQPPPPAADERAQSRPGRLILVSVVEPVDPALRALLEGGRAERLELRVAPGEGQPEAPPPFAGASVLTLRPATGEGGLARELEARLANAGTVFVRGGDFASWAALFRPGEHSTHVHRGLVHALRSGSDVVGLGGGASYLAGAALPEPGAREGPARNPRPGRAQAPIVGLGLGPPGLVEVRPAPGHHALRLLGELARTRIGLGLRMEGEVALVLDYAAGRVTVAGPGRVLVFDTRGAREERGDVRGARLSLLHAGDVWELGHRRALAAGGRAPLPPDPAWREPDPAARSTRMEEPAAELGAQLAPLAEGACRRLLLEGPFGALELAVDARSQRFEGASSRSVFDLSADWRAPAR